MRIHRLGKWSIHTIDYLVEPYDDNKYILRVTVKEIPYLNIFEEAEQKIKEKFGDSINFISSNPIGIVKLK